MGDSEVDLKRFRLIDQLLDAIFDLEPDQIPAFLEEACVGDVTLRAELERLLASDKRDHALMNSPAVGAAVDLLRET